ncbi:MAG: alginate export family protein [Brevundimonas sp.]|uniref:alginate export family protein n=1 Tax=Brevundimonas sp. TaxID=1871086 RepID=UPI002AB9060D|nr:alginate export family protein [Brevundimonas sp.]MDZ4111691.1 alginate export family protein [Brevundimonas sp.]
MPIRYAGALALILAAAPVAAQAQTADTDARVLFETRLRSETVDQQGFIERAHALTLRTRLGWRSPITHGLQWLIEGEGVAVLDARYSAPSEPVPGRPAVADGETLELNRAQLRWTGLPDTEVTVGRQRLIVGNSRFVGNVGWRQNEQTFDAVRLSTTALKPLAVTWVFADRVQRPLGREHPQGVWRGDIHLLQAEMDTPFGRLSGFGLAIDLDNAPAQSSTTVGARLAGSWSVAGDLSLTWAGEYAVQTDNGANPADYSLDFQAAAVGVQMPRWSVGLGYERFDGDGVSGFQTPLGTGHGFLGWSDVITTTPAFGVRDLFLRGHVGVPAWGRTLRLTAEAHAFHDAHGDFELGRELDLSAALPINARWSVELKAAHFEGDHPAFGDADKGWLTLEYRY